MTRDFAKGLHALEEVFDFLAEFAHVHGLGEEVELSLALVAEEVFTNMVKYGSDKSNRVRISVDKIGRQLRLELVDSDADPFDPDSVGPVALGASIRDRRAGGLGLHIVRSLMDRVEYQYRDGDRELRVLVTKDLER